MNVAPLSQPPSSSTVHPPPHTPPMSIPAPVPPSQSPPATYLPPQPATNIPQPSPAHPMSHPQPYPMLPYTLVYPSPIPAPDSQSTPATPILPSTQPTIPSQVPAVATASPSLAAAAAPPPTSTSPTLSPGTGTKPLRKPRKPYSSTKPREMWTADEHSRMVEGVRLYKRDWARVTKMVKTRTAAQVRSHAQKWFDRLEREGEGDAVPAARKKRRCKEPYPRNVTEGKGRWVEERNGGVWMGLKGVAKVPPGASVINDVKDEVKKENEMKETQVKTSENSPDIAYIPIQHTLSPVTPSHLPHTPAPLYYQHHPPQYHPYPYVPNPYPYMSPYYTPHSPYPQTYLPSTPCCQHPHHSPRILYSPMTPNPAPPSSNKMQVEKCAHQQERDGKPCVKCNALRKFGSAFAEIPVTGVKRKRTDALWEAAKGLEELGKERVGGQRIA